MKNITWYLVCFLLGSWIANTFFVHPYIMHRLELLEQHCVQAEGREP